MNTVWKGQAFTIAHADAGHFEGQGLRAFFEYRDLGIAGATGGAYGAHVIRREARHSDDLELIEIISPAECATHDANTPV